MSAGDAYAALGYIAAGLILLGAAAIAASILRRPRPVPGLPDDGKGCMSKEEYDAFGDIWLYSDETAAEPERSS